MEPALYQSAPAAMAELRIELQPTSSRESALATVWLPDGTGPSEAMEIPLKGLADPGEIDATEGSAILRGLAADPTQLLRDVGRRLFLTLFGGRLRRHYLHATEYATATKRPLAVVIAADSPHLVAQPWELLSDDLTRRSNEFLALSGWSVVRAPLSSTPNPERPQSPTLRVLVLLAELPFPVDRDLLRLRDIADTTKTLDVTFERSGSVTGLLNAIEGSGAQIVHYAGQGSHGGIQATRGVGIPPAQLAAELAKLTDLRLVVLNGSGTSETARQLAPAVPGVIGVRGQMLGDACFEFAGGLYQALANRLSIRAAVCAGRQQVRYRFPQDRYWSLPVHWDRGDAVLVAETSPAWDGLELDKDDDVAASADVTLLLEKRALAQRNLDAVRKVTLAQQAVPVTLLQQANELESQIAQLDTLLKEHGR